jgi:GNAT superfamily N-acetyltransferase
VRIRDARADDWAQVSDLLAELGRPDVRESEDEPRHGEAFARYLQRAETLALVAEEDVNIVGFVDVEFRQRLNFLSPQAWVPDLVVAERVRGQGVGRALLEAVEERARERGCWGMSLESAIWREGSHAFYERVGWSPTGMSFTRPLAADVQWPPAPR